MLGEHGFAFSKMNQTFARKLRDFVALSMLDDNRVIGMAYCAMRARDRHSWRSATSNWFIKSHHRLANPFHTPSAKFWGLSAFLVLVFVMGGSARGDIESLIILRPVSAVALGFTLTSLKWEQVRRYRWLFTLAVACVGLAIAQLAPLPLHSSYGLSGHSIIAEIDSASSTFGGTRPLSLAPSKTWNALWSMLLPLTVLVLGVQLSVHEQQKLLAVVLLIGIASAILGCAQTLSDPQGPLYYYDDMGRGLPVGLLTNRNCQAVFLASLLPMLAVWTRINTGGLTSSRSGKISPISWCTAVIGLCLLPIILLTGSRSGTLAGILACLSLPFVAVCGERQAIKAAHFQYGCKMGGANRILPGAILVIGLGLVGLAIWVGRAVSVDRLFATNGNDDLRIQIFPTVREMIDLYWPWGTGLGTFKPVYRVHETSSILMPMIMNHAHNDWLEVAMTAGPAGVTILLVTVVLWLLRLMIVYASRKSSNSPYFGRLGLVVIGLFALASVSDYHIRTPSISCLFVVAAIWACTNGIEAKSAGRAQ